MFTDSLNTQDSSSFPIGGKKEFVKLFFVPTPKLIILAKTKNFSHRCY